MTYTPLHETWDDHVVTTDEFGNITSIVHQSTTPINAAAMEYIEDGIASAGASSAFSLSASTSVGATSLTLSATPGVGWSVGRFILISPYTTRAEIRTITAISGSEITFAASRTAHTAGDEVRLIEPSYIVSPTQYGCTPGNSDNWGPMQRLMVEATAVGLKIGYFAAVAGSYVFQVSQPIAIPPGAQLDGIYLRTRGDYAPADPDGALAMVPSSYLAVTASAATNTFTSVLATHGMGAYSETNHTKVMFNAPYGETLPGGITAGKVYFIETVPTNATFKVSATSGGAAIDITSDGAAWAYTDIEQLARCYWDNVRFDATVPDVSCLRLHMQQPAYIRNIRVHQTATNTVDVFGARIGGQIGYIHNFMGVADDTPHVTILYLTGTGITVNNFNCQGGTGIEINGDAMSIINPWTEVCNPGILISGGRGTTISGSWLYAPSDAAYVALKVASTLASFQCGQIYNSSGGDMIMYQDSDRGIELHGAGAADATVATDYYGVFPGIQQRAYTLGHVDLPPSFVERFTISKAADYTVRYIDGTIIVNSTAASRTITLPAASPWNGHTYTIVHSSGANTCTIDTAGSETIDGAASITVPAGGSTTVVSNGTNYFTQSAYIPSSFDLPESTSQSGTTYTLALTDADTFIEFTSGAAVTVTVPPNADVAFPVNTLVELIQMGAGQVSIAGGTGVTLLSPSSKNKTAAQYAAASLRKQATNTWLIEGDIVA